MKTATAGLFFHNQTALYCRTVRGAPAPGG